MPECIKTNIRKVRKDSLGEESEMANAETTFADRVGRAELKKAVRSQYG